MAVTLAPVLAAWLRRAATPAGDGLALRGSVLLATLTPRARVPADVDHFHLQPIALADLAIKAHAIVAVPDPDPLAIESVETIWPDGPTPAVRVHLVGGGGALASVDLTSRETLALAPTVVTVPSIGSFTAVRAEELAAWKLHGLVEHGPGRWRAKDLYDLDVLAADVALDPVATRAAIEVAFASRGNVLADLADLRERPSWGESRGSRRRWRRLAATVPAVDPLPVVRDRVRAVLRDLLQGGGIEDRGQGVNRNDSTNGSPS